MTTAAAAAAAQSSSSTKQQRSRNEDGFHRPFTSIRASVPGPSAQLTHVANWSCRHHQLQGEDGSVSLGTQAEVPLLPSQCTCCGTHTHTHTRTRTHARTSCKQEPSTPATAPTTHCRHILHQQLLVPPHKHLPDLYTYDKLR